MNNIKIKSDRYKIFILTGSAFSIFFNLSAMPNIIRILAIEYSVGFKEASQLISTYQICYGFGALLSGYLNLKIGKKLSLILALSCFSILNFLIVLVDHFHSLVFLRGLIGIASSLIIPTSLAYIGDLKQDKGKKVGLVFASTSISGIIGVSFSGFVHWKLLFIVPAFLSFISLIASSLVLRTQKIRIEEFQKITWLSTLRQYGIVFCKREVYLVFSGIFFNSFMLGGVYAYLGFYFSSTYQIEKDVIGFVLTSSALGSILANFVTGVIIDKNKAKLNLYLGFIIICVNLYLLTQKIPLLYIFVVMFLLGMGRTFIHVTLVNKFLNFSSEIKPYVTSINSFIVFLAGSLSVIIFSSISQWMKVHNIILWISGCYAFGFITILLVACFLHKRPSLSCS